MLDSPQVYHVNKLSFCIYYNERNEPPHVHVYRGNAAAKYWLQPLSIVNSCGFNPTELRQIKKILHDRHDFFMEQWNATQTKVR